MPHRPPRVSRVPEPPTAEPPPRPGHEPITGLMIARASGAKIVIGLPGEDCCYAWRERVIALSPEVAMGTDVGSLIIAAEEAAHHGQPRWIHRLRFLGIVRLWEEADAFRRVKAFFARPAL